MAKFVYKMQNILSIKYKLEEQEKTNFGQAQIKVNEEEEKLNRLLEKRLKYENHLREIMSSKLNILNIKKIEDAIEIIKVNIKIQMVALNSAKQRLELARVRLNQAMIERKTHEKLREKAFLVFLEELKACENKEVDELNSFNYGNTNCGEEE